MVESLFEPFSHNQPQRILRGGFLGTSCQSRDRVPLITGFSSIRTWVTHPRHQLRRLGNKRFYQASGEAHRLFCPYKGMRIHPFYPRLLPPCLPIPAHSSSSAQARVLLLKPLQACSEQEASGWSPPLRRKISRSSERLDTWPRRSFTDSRPRDRSFLPPNPKRGWCSLRTSSAGWDSLSTHLSMD